MKITKVEYIKDYKLKLWFNDKKIKIVDLKSELKHPKGVFIPLHDLDYFKNVAVDDRQISICWPNGADFCPDVLYEIGIDVQERAKETITKSVHKRRTKTASGSVRQRGSIAAKSKY